MKTISILSLCFAVWWCGLFRDPAGVAATTYRWTDNQGNLHFTDDLTTVPSSLRDQVDTVSLPEPTVPPPPPAVSSSPASDDSENQEEDAEVTAYQDCTAAWNKRKTDLEQALVKDRALLEQLSRRIHLTPTVRQRSELQRTRVEVNARIQANEEALEKEIPPMQWECDRKKPYIP